MHEKKKIRTGLSIAISFFLSIFVFLLFLSVELKMGYFSERVFQKAIRAGSYGANMENAVSEKLKLLFAEQELPETLADDLTEEMDVYILFHNYAEKKSSTDSKTGSAKVREEFQEKCRTIVDAYLEEQEVYKTESIENSVELLAKQTGIICERYVYPEFVGKYYDMAQNMQKQLMKLAVLTVVFSVICVMALTGMYHYRHRALRYMVYSTITATILNIAVMLYLRYADVLEITGTAPEYYQQFVEQYRVCGLNSWYLVSGAGIAVSVLLLMLVKRLKHTVK